MKHYLKSKNKLSKEYFNALVAMAMADGLLKDEEIEFFTIKAQELGFPITNIHDMINLKPDALLDSSTIKIDEVDFITDIVAMAMIDGVVHQKEYELCLRLANKKGYSKSDIDNTIKLLNEFINEQNYGNENV